MRANALAKKLAIMEEKHAAELAAAREAPSLQSGVQASTPEPESPKLRAAAADAALRADLARLRIRELKVRAQHAHIDMRDVEIAIDESDDPRSAIIDLLMASASARCADNVHTVQIPTPTSDVRVESSAAVQ